MIKRRHMILLALLIGVNYGCSSISSKTSLSKTLPAGAEYYGRYEGSVVAKWNHNGRDMELVEPFRYITAQNVVWNAPKGSIVDGASIPKLAWSIIGGPFEGKYREASVVHDVACQRRMKPWQDTHLAFYTAMLTSGVNGTIAKIMYAAVYYNGPRWSRTVIVHDIPLDEVEHQTLLMTRTSKDFEKPIFSFPGELIASNSDRSLFYRSIRVDFVPLWSTISERDFDELRKKIEQDDLSLDEIRSYRPQTSHKD